MLKKILPYIEIILIVVVIRVFIVTPVRVNGKSMEPTIKDSEIMFLVKIKKYFTDYKRFDIVVVHAEDDYLIKRVIALPKETIEVTDGIIYINGKELEEDYGVGIGKNFEKTTLKDDEYFLMGDNRKASLDSTSFGPFKNDEIRGYANLVIFPFNKIRTVE